MKFLKKCLLGLLLAAVAVVPAMAAEGEPPAEDVVTMVGQLDLFQSGSFTGEYTTPGGIQLLDTTADTLYQTILTNLQNRAQSFSVYNLQIQVTVTGTQIDQTSDGYKLFKSTYEKVVNDHPELFYVRNGYSLDAMGSGGTYYLNQITPNYGSESAEQKAAFDAKADEIVGMVDQNMSELEKVLFFHDYLALNVAYNHTIANHGTLPSTDPVYSAYGALIDGDAVCQGYALAYKLLLTKCNIDCVMVSSNQLNHAWNAVQLGDDTNWYYVDVTWDDPIDDKYGRCLHDNFLLSEDGLKATGHEKDGQAVDWSFNPEGDADASKKYESGYAFNGVDTALYRWNGQYYYIQNQYAADKPNTISGNAKLYCGSLDMASKTEKATITQENTYSMAVFSAVWQGDKLFCLGNFGGAVVQVDLSSGAVSKLGDVVDQGKTYPGQNCGLRYNAEKNQLEVWSDLDRNDGTREKIDSFAIKAYPLEWDNASTATTNIVGTNWDGNDLQIGLVWNGSETETAQCLVAFYQGGRLTAVRQIETANMTEGLNVFKISGSDIPEIFDSAKLFLLDQSNSKPLTEQETILQRSRAAA